jgi:hypothetical protein
MSFLYQKLCAFRGAATIISGLRAEKGFRVKSA